ncbi:MAG: hypothetical protein JJU05_02280 [Verrucomicrobia bacterium]|nr:hypothetical protein [Verrucomicrobiota bacterium]MCH8528089.1 hypothetical protein [Kiritimatiellia bacterium]
MKNLKPGDTPFAEPESRRWIWIVPSVLLHVLILGVWLMQPEKPPRDPAPRRLTVTREQAESLQQHVEDANVVLLRQNVSELQAIKTAMASIRDSRMERLRDFETVRVREAPLEAMDTFNRFLALQPTIIGLYQELKDAILVAEAETPDAETARTGEGLEAAMPALRELGGLRGNVLSIQRTLAREMSQALALLNTGETQLEWMTRPEVAGKRSELNLAMERAVALMEQLSGSVNAAYDAGWALTEVLRNANMFVNRLKRYDEHMRERLEREAEQGPLTSSPPDWLVNDANVVKNRLGRILDTSPQYGLIPDAVQAQEEVTRHVSDLLEMIAGAGDQPSLGGTE